MNLADFWFRLDALSNKPEAHPEIDVVIAGPDGEFQVSGVEIRGDGDNGYRLSIQTVGRDRIESGCRHSPLSS